jgi:hypothetical protein
MMIPPVKIAVTSQNAVLFFRVGIPKGASISPPAAEVMII